MWSEHNEAVYDKVLREWKIVLWGVDMYVLARDEGTYIQRSVGFSKPGKSLWKGQNLILTLYQKCTGSWN